MLNCYIAVNCPKLPSHILALFQRGSTTPPKEGQTKQPPVIFYPGDTQNLHHCCICVVSLDLVYLTISMYVLLHPPPNSSPSHPPQLTVSSLILQRASDWILRQPDRPRFRLPTRPRHHLSRSEAGKHPHRRFRIFEGSNFYFCTQQGLWKWNYFDERRNRNIFHSSHVPWTSG